MKFKSYPSIQYPIGFKNIIIIIIYKIKKPNRMIYIKYIFPLVSDIRR